MHEPKRGNSDTIEYLRTMLLKAGAREDWIMLWLVIGISLGGLVSIAIIVYLLVKE